MKLFEFVAAVLVADFLSGFFHWLEDAYGREHWPVTGRWVTRPNILHHLDARYFTRHGWFHSSWLLLCLAALLVVIAAACGALTWHVWLAASLGANANQIHKWTHRTRAENGKLISMLQSLHLLQSPRHHAHHHTDPKNSHYCVITNFLNPLLDGLRFWTGLERVIQACTGIVRRPDPSLRAVERDPHLSARLASTLDPGASLPSSASSLHAETPAIEDWSGPQQPRCWTGCIAVPPSNLSGSSNSSPDSCSAGPWEIAKRRH